MERALAGRPIRILPGVIELLETLSAMPEFALGLVTGNIEAGARIKLANAGIDHYFSLGGYGSDSEDRTALIRIGIARCADRIAPAPVQAAFVIGDTSLDILQKHRKDWLPFAPLPSWPTSLQPPLSSC